MRPPHDATEASRPKGQPAKRLQILAGARDVFLEVGFERAAVDAIAARAGVSKATLYSHFADKQALFVACAQEESAGMRERLATLTAADTGDPARDLAEVGEAILCFLARPRTLAFRRILMAEGSRFPELGRTFHEDAARSIRGRIASYLRQCAGRGLLTVEDEQLAATQFLTLTVADLLWQLELGVLPRITGAVAKRAVKEALATFLRAHAPAPSGALPGAPRQTAKR